MSTAAGDLDQRFLYYSDVFGWQPRDTNTVAVLGTCRWCSTWHIGTCPRVKSIEYFPDGTVKRVEFVRA